MGAFRARIAGWTSRHPVAIRTGLLAGVVLIAAGWYFWADYAHARDKYREARDAAERREWKKADELVKEALDLRPDSADNHLLAARVERRLEHLDQARRHLDTAQKLLGGETLAIQVERALVRLHAGEFAAVEPFLRECVRQDSPDSVEILDLMAAALEVNYRVAEAQQCLDDLLRRQPDHFDALVRRGRTARTMGWHEDAVGYFEKALALRPEVDSVRAVLAETQGTYGQFDRARANFEHLLRRQPGNGAYRFGLALCYAGTGQADKALPIFNELLAVNPDNWMALLERGKLAVQQDRPDLGLPDLRRADALAPPDTSPTALVACLLALGKRDEARKYQEKADRILAERKRMSELGDRIRETPNDPDPRSELGRLLLQVGKQREGVHWLRTALEKDPKYRPAHEALAQFFESVNAVNEALLHRRALQQLGGNPPR